MNAYEQGKWANIHDKRINPFQEGSNDWREWNRGWWDMEYMDCK